jgi:CDP-diacylglycerol pyrophosphatase
MPSVPGPAKFRASATAAAICASVASLVLVVLLLPAAPAQDVGPRDVLRKIVQDLCVPDQLQRKDPTPCAEVNLDGGVARGFAILKDIRGNTQYLLISTARIGGIEGPEVIAAGAPNYFADAWDARTYIDQALHQTLSRDDIALAINSAPGRTQDQLHIHIDCVRPDVQATLRAQASSIGTRWAPLNVPLAGHHYEAIWVSGETLGATNPFRLLADGVPGAAQDMGDRTLVVTGSSLPNGTQGFIILEDQVDPATGDKASGEELQDHDCRIANSATASGPQR